MDQQGSPCYGSITGLTGRYGSKVNHFGPLDAKKLAAAVLLYVFNKGLSLSLLQWNAM